MGNGQDAQPGYAEDAVFQRLVALASQAGIRVDFVDDVRLEESLAESDPEAQIILMTAADAFPPGVAPASVLAEEMAYILTESAQPRYREYFALNDMENSSELISVALVQLAEMMVSADIARQYKILREIRKPNG